MSERPGPPFSGSEPTVVDVSESGSGEHSYSAFSPGDVLLHRFRIVRCIGRGGMGEVYEAEDLQLGRVALKTVLPRYSDSAEMLRRFRDEVKIARKVTGVNVCRIFELFTIDTPHAGSTAAFLTMEFLDGETLDDRMQHGPVDWRSAYEIALDVCSGLSAIHQAGILHRDLTCRNIMLADRYGRTRGVLTDFGLALPIGVERKRGMLEGTLNYMSPEQIEGNPLTPATDVYALGIVLYQLVTGQHPFRARSTSAATAMRARQVHISKAPRGWREIILRCLEYEPEKRFASADAVAVALRRAHNPFMRTVHESGRWAKRHRVVLGICLLACLAFVAWQATLRMRLHVPPAEARRWYDRGVSSLQEATYVKAIHALEVAVERDPKFAMAHARLAEAWNELDFSGSADHEMLLASREANDQRMTSRDRVELAVAQATLVHDYAEAVRRESALLDREDDDTERAATLVDRGRAEEKAGEIDAALADFQHAARLAPDEPAAFVHIGILEGRSEKIAAANAAFARAEDIYRAASNDEGIAEVEFQRGYVADDTGHVDEARQHLQEALQMAKNINSIQLEIRTLSQLSSVASYATDQTESRQLAEQAIELADANGLAAWAGAGYMRLGNSYLLSGDPAMLQKAIQAYQQSLSIAKQNSQPRLAASAEVGLANCFYDDPDRAALYAQQAYDYWRQFGFTQNTQTALTLLARAQAASGNLDAALVSTKKLLAAAEKNGNQQFISLEMNDVGSVLLQQEQFPDAVQYLRTAYAQSSGAQQQAVLINLMIALGRLGRFSEVEALLAAHPQQPRDSAMLLALMDALQTQYRDATEKMEPYEQSLRPEERVLYARSLAHTGRVDDARTELREIPDGELARIGGSALVELAWLEKDSGSALAKAQEVWDRAEAKKLRESAIFAAAYSAMAAEALHDGDAQKFARQGLDIAAGLEQAWRPEDYASFSSRPDIRDLLLELRRINSQK